MTKQDTSKLNYTNARLLAVQALYSVATSDTPWDKVMSQGLLGAFGGQALVETGKNEEEYIPLPAADNKLFTAIVQSYREHREDIDTAIRSALSEKISFDKLDLTFLCILRAALAEFYAAPETDAPIIINEYVDMTRSFYDGSEVKIANALLDKFASVLKS